MPYGAFAIAAGCRAQAQPAAAAGGGVCEPPRALSYDCNGGVLDSARQDPSISAALRAGHACSASRSFRAWACACALLTPRANPGSFYHRGKST